MTAETPREGRLSSHDVAPGLSAFRATRAEMAAVGRKGNFLSKGHPTLSVLIYNTTLCMKIKVVTSWPDDTARRMRQRVLAEAEFQPSEVTTEKLVQWAYNALAAVMRDRTWED